MRSDGLFALPAFSEGWILTGACHDIVQKTKESKLILVTAAAGYGKSTLFAQVCMLLKKDDERCLWLPLGESINSFESLVNNLRLALERMEGAELTNRLLDQELPATEAPLHADKRVLAYLKCLEEPLYIFIEDYHLLECKESNEFIEQLLSQCSHCVHLLMSSRTEPMFPYGRWVVTGKAVQYKSEDLCLTMSEVKEFAKKSYEYEIADEEVEQIYEKTEGWPIAVQMCILLIIRSGNSDFLMQPSWGQKDISRYLQEQVFNSLDADIKERMARIAIFDEFDSAMLDSVLMTSNAGLLNELSRQNMFIYELGHKPLYFRFHPIFKTFLQTCDQAPQEEERERILSASVEYFRSRDRKTEAIVYALKCHKYDVARELLVESAEKIVRDEGLLPEFLQWCSSIPKEDTSQSFILDFWYTWALSYSGRHLESEKKISDLLLDIESSKKLKKMQKKKLKGRVETLVISNAIFLDKEEVTLNLTDIWLKEHKRSADLFDVAVVYASRSLAARLRLNYAEAKRSLGFTKSIVSQVRSPYGQMWVAVIECLQKMEFGSYLEARDVLESFYQELRRVAENTTVMRSTMALLLSRIEYELGDTVRAKKLCHEGMVHIMDHGIADTAASGIEVHALLLKNMNPEQALPWLKKIESFVQHYPSRLAFLLGRTRIQFLLLSGKKDEAIEEAREIDLELSSKKIFEAYERESNKLTATEKVILAAYMLFDLRRYEESYEAAKQLKSVASTSYRPHFMVRLYILEVALLMKKNKKNLACRRLNLSVQIAEKNGLKQVFIDRISYIQDAIRLIYQKRLKLGYEESSVIWKALFDCLNIKESYRRDIDPSTLTRKERAVLERLESDMSVQDLADYFFVSKAAIKWHLNNIYKKLQVNNRHSAIAVARENGLI